MVWLAFPIYSLFGSSFPFFFSVLCLDSLAHKPFPCVSMFFPRPETQSAAVFTCEKTCCCSRDSFLGLPVFRRFVQCLFPLLKPASLRGSTFQEGSSIMTFWHLFCNHSFLCFSPSAFPPFLDTFPFFLGPLVFLLYSLDLLNRSVCFFTMAVPFNASFTPSSGLLHNRMDLLQFFSKQDLVRLSSYAFPCPHWSFVLRTEEAAPRFFHVLRMASVVGLPLPADPPRPFFRLPDSLLIISSQNGLLFPISVLFNRLRTPSRLFPYRHTPPLPVRLLGLFDFLFCRKLRRGLLTLAFVF